MKLHSGRRADTRDLVVLAGGADFDRIVTQLHRGDTAKLVARIDTVLDRLTADGFEDAFKGIFERQTIPTSDIDAVAEFLRDQRIHLDSQR